ncbi:MAG: UvrD-helicase domain-containing protein [Bacteroidia bacterium]|nr:UvrD-helicase domain-containing protein [Bacteroidia bacterium]
MSLGVILASAGSGKTQRLAKLAIETLKNPASTPRGVLAITFTRNAAAELRQRILDLLLQGAPDIPTDEASRDLARKIILGQVALYTQTIDSLVRELYQRVAPLLGIPVFGDLIVEEEDYIEIAHQLSQTILEKQDHQLKRLLVRRLEGEIEQRAARIDPAVLLRNELLNLMQEGPLRAIIRKALYTALLQGTSTPLEESWEKALGIEKREALFTSILLSSLERYRTENQRLFLSDISALVQFTARFVESLIAEHTAFYSHLLVDEAQDTSPQQWEILTPIIQELRASNKPVTLIGDPKQSIYAWREADFRKLLEFYEAADKQETLSENFRSDPQIVKWNNRLYGCISHRLSRSVESRKGKKSRDTSARKEAALSAIQNLYDPGQVLQAPAREALGGEVRVVRLPYEKDKEKANLLRAEKLREILEELKVRGIPPHQTAFLVRRNDDISTLLELLPEYPLQVQEVRLGQCTSLAVTFRWLAGEKGAVEREYLSHYQAEHILNALEEGISSALSPLEKWRAFYKAGEEWIQKLPKHRPFWKLFLSRFYAFIYRHPIYQIAEICRWWEAQGQHILLDFPAAEGTYPILTIHKAKGLAWEAVIVPFANWGLLNVSWRDVLWRPLAWDSLPPALESALQTLKSLFPDKLPLPLKVSSDDKNFAQVYEDFAVQQIVENLNLHYVATTRARRYLYLIASEPASKAYSGANSWQGFWTDENLSGDLWSQEQLYEGERR